METAAAIRRLRQPVRPAAGRKRGSAKPASQRAPEPDPNGFLNHCFRPFWGITNRDWKQSEKEFFTSLSHLCTLYKFPLPETGHLEYPLNITTAFRQVREWLVKINMDAIIFSDKKRKACIATVKSFDTGHTLYYVPVRPLWLLLNDAKQQPALSQLIGCVFRYLYQVAGVPYYREDGYLYNQYETLTDWIENDPDDDEDYREEQAKEMERLKEASDQILPLLKTPLTATGFQQAIDEYSQLCNCKKEPLELAASFLQLFTRFPARSIHHSLQKSLLHPDESEYIYLEQYLSFYWSGSDCFYDILMDMINTELQETGFQEEPVSLQCFDQPQETETHDFSFEQEFFSLVDKLTEWLMDYDITIPKEEINSK